MHGSVEGVLGDWHSYSDFEGLQRHFARLRARVVPQGPVQPDEASESVAATDCDVEHAHARPNRISWARLLKRVFDIDMQHCPNCGSGELKIIAATLERAVIEKILSHLGLQAQPPPRTRAREAQLDQAG